MCNLYNVTTTRDAVLQFTKAFRDRAGWNEASFDVYPGYQAPIVRVAEDGQREIARATWGMPSPPAYVKNYDPGVTNIRNVNSPHWRRWLGPTSRCVVPFTSFAEPDPASKIEGGRVPNAWFAGNEGELSPVGKSIDRTRLACIGTTGECHFGLRFDGQLR